MPIKIDGLQELSEALKHESVRTAKRYLVNCAKPAADVVIEAMEQTVPVDVGKLEGNLGYQTRFSNDGGPDVTTLTVNIGPARSTFWGLFSEFGTFCQPGIHWMSRAFESCKDRVLSVFATELTARLMDLQNKK
jgi:HK97 gp10 family phage protein